MQSAGKAGNYIYANFFSYKSSCDLSKIWFKEKLTSLQVVSVYRVFIATAILTIESIIWIMFIKSVYMISLYPKFHVDKLFKFSSELAWKHLNPLSLHNCSTETINDFLIKLSLNIILYPMWQRCPGLYSHAVQVVIMQNAYTTQSQYKYMNINILML